ncbi:uncharacterized protein METZ01_LOCUS336952, partial [marine metagenome]
MIDQPAIVKRNRAPARNLVLWGATLLVALLCRQEGTAQDGADNADQYFRLVQFRRGDVNIDGSVDVSDALGIFNWLFLGGAGTPCENAADSNKDVSIDLTDGVHIL